MQPNPPPLQPPPQINIQAARDAAQERDERWMQQIRNGWRNEQQAQQQLQQDEEEEEHRRWDEERELIRRQQRLEEVANNMSRQALADSEASNSHSNYQNHVIQPQPPAHPPFQPMVEHQAPLQPPPPQPPVRNQRRNRGPRGRTPYQEPAGRHSLGLMNVSCPHCQALHFAVEKLTTSTRNALKFGMCCLTNQICLPALRVKGSHAVYRQNSWSAIGFITNIPDLLHNITNHYITNHFPAPILK